MGISRHLINGICMASHNYFNATLTCGIQENFEDHASVLNISTRRINSKAPNQHSTSALLMCMGMWQTWLHVHVMNTYMYC